MRNFVRCSILILLLGAGQWACAATMVIAVSPHQAKSDGRREATIILKSLTELEPGDEAILTDGVSLMAIGTFTVPRGGAYANPKARLAANAKAVGALMKLSEGAQGTAKAVRLPQLLRHVAATYGAGAPLDVLIFGSPFYNDPNEPEFSMADGLIPNDAHLGVSRAKSPFGTADSTAGLSGLRVHFCYGSESMIPTDKHRYFIERFWALYIARQGGTLVTFAADPSAVFQRVRAHAASPVRNDTIEPGTKLEMMRLRREAVGTSLYERALSASDLPIAAIRQASNVELGITWDCARCDLDLYAQPGRGEVLYFNHTQSPDGIHVKDFLQSPKVANGYETIVFRAPVDLRELRIAINFYEGAASGGVTGELRLSVDGQTYAARFRLAASAGNKADGVAQAMQSLRSSDPQTIVIDPLSVIRQRQS